MNKIKTWILLTACFVLVAHLVSGCQTTEEIDLPEPTPAPATEIPAPTDTVPAPAPTEDAEPTGAEPATRDAGQADAYAGIDPGGRTVAFWHSFTGSEEAALIEITEAFNAANQWGISVSPEYQGSYDDLQDKMLTFMNTRDAPELVMVSGDQGLIYQLGEALIDIDQLVNHDTWGLTQEEESDYFPGLFNQGISPFFDNNRLSFPVYGSLDVLFYNLDWLGELGYDSPPSNPEAFLEISCAATLQPYSGSTDIDRIGYEFFPDAATFSDWALSFGGKAFNQGTGQYYFESSATSNAMTYLQDFSDRGCARMVENSGDNRVDFGRGVSLFAIASSEEIPEYRASIESEANFNWRVAPLPNSGQQPITNARVTSASIPKTTPESQLASWLFLKYFTGPEAQARWAQATGYLPVRASAGGSISGSPAFMMSLDLMKYAISETITPGYAATQALSAEALRSMMTGGEIESTLTQLSSDANAILAEQIALIPESPDPWAEVDPSGQTITFWHNHTDERAEALLEIVQEFNNTNKWGITVIAEHQGGYGDILLSTLPVLGTPESPNLVVAYPSHAAIIHQSEGLVDMTSLVESTKWGLAPQDADDFFPAIFRQDIFPIFNNVRLGFPVQRSTDLLYYNADWLAELGYDSVPTTPEAFRQMVCQATATPFSASLGEGSSGYLLYLDASHFADWVYAFGGDFFNRAELVYDFDNQEIGTAMNFLQEMITEECAFTTDDRVTTRSNFADGSLLFMVDSSLRISGLAAAIEEGLGFEWGVAPLPKSAENPVQNVFGASLSIPVSTPEKELASWLFIKHFTSPEFQAQWIQTSHYLPVRISSAEYLADYFDANPKIQQAFDLFEFGTTEPSLPGYDLVRQEIELGLSTIAGGAEVVDTLIYLDEVTNQILAGHQTP